MAAQELAEVRSCDHMCEKLSVACVVVRQARRVRRLVNIRSRLVPFLAKTSLETEHLPIVNIS